MSADATSKVQGPALGLQITAGIVALMMLVMTLNSLLKVGQTGPAPEVQVSSARMLGHITGALMVGTLGLVYAWLIPFGAMRMKSLRSYGLCMTATILALNPLCFPSCLLGFPMGVWALIALLNQDVKEAFRAEV